MTTNASRGIATDTSLRLCSRAPETTIWDCRDTRSSVRNGRTEPSNTCSFHVKHLDGNRIGSPASRSNDDPLGPVGGTRERPRRATCVEQHTNAEPFHGLGPRPGVLDRSLDGGARGGAPRAQARPVRSRGADPGARCRLHARRRILRGIRPHRVAPAARQPQRQADDGDGFRVLHFTAAQPARLVRRAHPDGAVRRRLDLLLRRIAPHAADERAPAAGPRPAARGVVRRSARDRPGRLDALRPGRGPPAARIPGCGRLPRDRQDPARAARLRLRRHDHRVRGALGGRVGAAAPRAVADDRGRARPAVLHRAAGQRPRHRNALAGAALAGGLLARDGAGGVPRRPAALAAGARRARRRVPRSGHDAWRRTPDGAAARPRRPGAGALRFPAPPPSRAPAPGARSPPWNATAAASQPSSTTRRWTRTRSWSRPPARRRRSRSRTSTCMRSPMCSSPS